MVFISENTENMLRRYVKVMLRKWPENLPDISSESLIMGENLAMLT